MPGRGCRHGACHGEAAVATAFLIDMVQLNYTVECNIARYGLFWLRRKRVDDRNHQRLPSSGFSHEQSPGRRAPPSLLPHAAFASHGRG